MIPWWLAVGLGVPLLAVAFIAGVFIGDARLPWHPRGLDVDLVGAKPTVDVIALDWSERTQPAGRFRYVPGEGTLMKFDGDDAA